MNCVAVLSNLDKDISNILAYFDAYIFLPVESGPVPFDKLLFPLIIYPLRNEYYPY